MGRKLESLFWAVGLTLVVIASMASCKKEVVGTAGTTPTPTPTTNNNSGGTSGLYTPTAADVTSTATLADLQAGRVLYINTCGRCHALHSPDSYTASRWKTIVSSHAGRINLSATETAQLLKYVTRGQ